MARWSSTSTRPISSRARSNLVSKFPSMCAVSASWAAEVESAAARARTSVQPPSALSRNPADITSPARTSRRSKSTQARLRRPLRSVVIVPCLLVLPAILRPAPISRGTARLLGQADLFDGHFPVHGLDHVVDREARDGD